jgi:NifU-like protein
MWQYSDKVRDHFLNPRNAGELSDATVVGEAGSLATGDALKLFLRVENDVITAARFQTFGNPGAIASASALTEMITGKPVDEAARITSADISKFLDGLPEEKMSAPVLAMEALENAYAKFRRLDGDDDLIEQRLICRCFNVSQGRIERAIRDNNLSSVIEITNHTKAGGGCHSCHVDLENLLSRARAERSRALEEQRFKQAREEAKNRPAPAGISDLQRAALIQEVLDREVRPGLAMDGGDMELVGVDGAVVKVKLNGHCVSCSSSTATMRFFVEDKLRELVDPAIEVIDVTEHGDVLHAPPMR